MPLIQGKSKEAMSKNIKAEMNAGRPQKQAVAIAYAIRRKNAQKHAEGGMINEKLHPEHEPHVSHIVEAIMKKDPSYSDGGEIESTRYSESGDDLFSDDPSMELEMANGGMLEADNPEMGHKKRLTDIMSRIRMKHMGHK